MLNLDVVIVVVVVVGVVVVYQLDHLQRGRVVVVVGGEGRVHVVGRVSVLAQ